LRECSALDAEGLSETLVDASTLGRDCLEERRSESGPSRELPPQPSTFVWRPAPDLPER
jgi:hypothetical protein